MKSDGAKVSIFCETKTSLTEIIGLCRRDLVAAEDVAGIDLGGDVAEGVVEAVGDDGFAAGLEGGEVVDDEAAEEGGAVGERGLVDDDLGALGLDALHDALDGGLAEVVGVGLHRQAIDADDGGLSPALAAILVVGAIGVPAGLGQHGVGDVVLARAVGLDDGGHHVLGHVLVVGEQLLRIFREAVAAIAEGGVVVVGADAGVEADALDDGAAVEALDLGVGVELVEVADAEGEVGVGEEFHGLGLLHAHAQDGDALGLFARADTVGDWERAVEGEGIAIADSALYEQGGEGAGSLAEAIDVGDGGDGLVFIGEVGVVHLLRVADDDAARVEVVVEGLALAEELGGEEEVELLHALARVAEVEAAGVAHGDGRFDDHHGVGVDGQHEVDDFLDVGGVEVVLHGVVVGGGGDHDEVGVGIGRFAVESSNEGAMAWLLSLIGAHAGQEAAVAEVFLDVVVLDGRDATVEFLDFLGDDIDCCHMVVLGQQGGNAQANVACAGHGDLDIFEITHIFDYFFLQNNFETDKSVCGEYKKNNLNNGDNLNNFVKQMNLSLGEVEKQLGQRETT